MTNQQNGLGWATLNEIVGNNKDYNLYHITYINKSKSWARNFNYVYTNPSMIEKLEEQYKEEEDTIELYYDRVRDSDPIRFFLGQYPSKDHLALELLYYKFFMENTWIYYIKENKENEDIEINNCYELEGIDNFWNTMQSLSK